MKTRYYLKGRFTILIGLLMLSAAVVCTAEEITLTTYYPSPYGVYSEMRLYPKGGPSSASCQEGLMFYSDGSGSYTRGLYVCGGSPLGWQLLSSLWTLSPSGTNLYPNINSWNVGIGTTNPGTNKLSVAGTGRFTNTLYLDTQGTSSGQAIHAGRSITAGTGLTGGGQLTSDRTIRLDTSSISGCTDATNNKIYWGGSRLTCGTDQGGGSGGNVTITAPGGSFIGSSFNFVGNVTYSGGNTFTFGGGSGPGGSVYSLIGGSGITLSGPGVSGNTWNPSVGTATIVSGGGPGGGNITITGPAGPATSSAFTFNGAGVSQSGTTFTFPGGGLGNVTPWLSPELSDSGGSNEVLDLGTHQFCALAYHWENTGGGGDDASCRITFVGNRWTLTAHQGTDANVICQAVCF